MVTASGQTLDYSNEPTALIFADRAEGREAAEEAVLAGGGRVAAVWPLAAAAERLSGPATYRTVIVDIGDDGGDALDEVFDRLDENARAGRHTSIVILPTHLIDVAAARAGHSDVALLCDPEPFERIAAIGAALARPRHRLSDVNAEGGAQRLRELAEEVARIAKMLSTIASDDLPRPPATTGPRGEPGDWPVDAGMIRSLIRARRMRSQFFPPSMFADPAWDMLLDLAAAKLEGRAVAVSSLCIASAVPPTTALRWIKTLTDARLFARVADSTDGRRVFIELTDQAQAGMIGYLVQLQRVLPSRQ